jgi:diaminohydroxyphosphoribosylaminopyrimidine deaminase/5-amino-6-(5-phosphoribosylamino)uracil reductase
MDAQLTGTDRAHLRRALELAEGGRGRVSPNPLVGAVIVRGGEVIGEGFHAELGDLHAERAALEDCRRRGEDPAGATMYVSLEPCAHQGRQPPCTEAILEAGIGRVVIASEDPSEKASGRGPGMLRDGEVKVEFAAGEEATAARLLNQPFRKHARTGLPLVTLKLAMSLDGGTTTAAEDSPWISGEESRQLVHRWRGESDAIAVGIGTVLADDPLLTARAPGATRQPVRVVFDSHARLPLGSKLLATLDESPVLVIVSPEANSSHVIALRESGAEVVVVDGATPAARIDAALSDLGRRNLTSLLLEGGRTLAAAFVGAEAIDEARTFVAPTLLGSTESDVPGGEEGGGVRAGAAVSFSHRLLGERRNAQGKKGSVRSGTPTLLQHRMVGEDVLITVRFKEW